MVLYDHHKRILAISDQTLEMLGYQSVEKFRQEIYDIAQLFVKRPGYLHEFRSFHWIDYVLTNATVTHRTILRTKTGKEIETFVNVNQLTSIKDMLSYYLVTFEFNPCSDCDFNHISPLQEQTQTPPKTQSLKNKKKGPTQKETQKRATDKLPLKPKDFQEPNLDQIGEELNLGPDIVEDFIKEYVKHAIDKLPQINEAIRENNQKELYETIHTLKGVAANLRLKPAFDILSKMKKNTPIKEAIGIIEEFYSYILFLAKLYGIDLPKELYVQLPHTTPQPSDQQSQNTQSNNVPPPQNSPKPPTQEAPNLAQECSSNPIPLAQKAKEVGLSLYEYQEYLKELINEIKLNLAYNNFSELHKLASFARNLYLQECAKYLDQVNVHQNPELVKKCIRDLEELKKAPNPFIVTFEDLKDALHLIQIDKEDFIDIIEDLIVELKALRSIKMKKEKFLKKAKQLKSVAESLRLSNLVLLLSNIISNYPLDDYNAKQLEEAIEALETNVKQL